MEQKELKTVAANFTSEITRATGGEKTSFHFIKHHLSSTPVVSNNEVFQGMVVGGTVFKSGKMKRSGRGRTVTILEASEGKQPVFDTRETFLTFLETIVDPDVSVLGLNMAYPLSPVYENGRLDGSLVQGTKEHAFAGLEGKKIGSEIQTHLKKVRGQDITVSVANDTICLLLSGLTQYPWHKVAAGIVGTGVNFALFLDETTLVNLESANFDKFTQWPEGKAIDEKSQHPGASLAEKEMAGAYLYRLFNERASREGVKMDPLTSTDQIDKYAKQCTHKARLKGDFLVDHEFDNKNKACTIAYDVLNRSASLAAVQIAGIANYLKRDTAFVMEGSLFWKAFQYRETVERYVQQLVPKYNVSYIHVPDSGILGAAKLVA